MGTNYYHITNECSCCGRYDQEHIGKLSGGWAFHFYGAPTDPLQEQHVRTYQEWLERLKAGGRIEDGYGNVVSLADFQALVDQAKHLRNWGDHWPGKRPSDEWRDAEGYWFAGYSFC